MKIRTLKPADIETIEGWYAGRSKKLPPEWMRGDFGFMVEDRSGTPVAVAFLIRTYSGICLCEHVQTNPQAPQYTQSKALGFLVRSLVLLVKDMGYRCIMGFVPEGHKSLQKFYRRNGGLSPEVTYRAFYKEV